MRASLLAYVALPSCIILAAACGGESFSTSGDGDGDAATGGNDATGGGSTGGSATGGDGTGGSATGGSSTGGTSSLDRECFSSFDCELVQNACCSICDVPTLDDVMAITRGQDDLLREELCGPDGLDCPDCEPPANPNLFAQCVRGVCEAQDIRQHDDAACDVDADCVLVPAACCPCGAGNDPGEFVAASRSADSYQEAQCDTTPLCDDCQWEPPLGVTPICDGSFCALPPPPNNMMP